MRVIFPPPEKINSILCSLIEEDLYVIVRRDKIILVLDWSIPLVFTAKTVSKLKIEFIRLLCFLFSLYLDNSHLLQIE